MTFASVNEADRFVTSFCSEYTLDEKRCFKIRLVIEELITNIFKYADAQTFTLSVIYGDPIKIEITYLSDAFDLTTGKLKQNKIAEIEEGGLGLFLVESMAKTFIYRHQNGKNIYTLTI